MKLRNRLFALLSAAMVLVPLGAAGQDSSINTYSPYSFFGLGDINTQGPSGLRSMGGAGVAFREFFSINYLNPAAYSSGKQQSALFQVGLEGQNYYLKDANSKNSYNSFNLRDLAFQMPLAKGLGFAFSMTPYSSVGYDVRMEDVVADIGYIEKLYSGQGGLNQFKFGVGYEIWPGKLSIGAELAYYHGNIERNYSLTPYPVTGQGSYLGLSGTNTEKINTFFGNFGIQTVLVNDDRNILTLGAVYRMGGKLRGTLTEYIPHIGSSEPIDNAVRYKESPLNMKMPHIFTAGLSYVKPKYMLVLDYTFNAWSAANENWDSRDNISFRDTHSVSFGGEFTPDANSVRSFFSRSSYRFGVRYSQYYMRFDGNSFNDKAISIGFGLPLDSRNSIDIGFEYGMRGTTKFGLTQENYFKFSVGVKLFGEDYWFTKLKYD